MKSTIKKIVSVLLVTIMLLSTAPMSEIAKIDFLSIFNTIASAVEKTFKLGNELGNIEIVSTKRGNQKAGKALSTQADDVSANLTVGDTLELRIHVYKKDDDGNLVEAEVGEFPEVSWFAYPASSVELTVGSPDTRYCSIKVISDSSPTVSITASMAGQNQIFKINISSLTFDKLQYYVLVDDTQAVADLGSIMKSYCYAIWTPKDENISPDGFRFTSSDESILKIDDSESHSEAIGNRYNIYPGVYGVSEGEVTLTIETPDEQTASCSVRVVGMKEYLVEAYSEDLETPLADSNITYKIIRGGALSSSETTVKTGSDGIAKVLLPDAQYCNSELSIDADAHEGVKISSEGLKEDEINRENLELDFDIQNIALPSATIDGPSGTINDETKSLFQFDMGMDLGLSNDDEIGTNTIGDLIKSGKKIKLKINVVEKSLEILFGFENKYLDTEKGWNECYKDAKNLYNFLGKDFYDDKFSGGKNNIGNNTYKRAYDKLKKESFNFIAKVEGSFFFFAKFSWSSGKLQLSEGGAVVTASLKYEKQFPGYLGTYVKLKFGTDGEGKVVLKYEKKGQFVFGFDLKIKLYGSLGVGIGFEGIGVDVNGAIEFIIKFHVGNDMTSWADFCEIYFTGKITLEGHINFWFLNTETTFAEWKFPYNIYLFPPSKFGEIHTNNLGEISYVIDRGYLNEDKLSTQNSSNSIQSVNTYPYSDPKMVKLSDGRIVSVWLTDDGSKTDPNCTTLYYSVYSNGTWSSPTAVYESGRADEAPALATDGQKVYLLYQRGSKVFSNDSSVEEYVANTELVYSCFDSGKWSNPIVVGTGANGKYKSQYSIAAKNNIVLISWIENSDNNPYAATGTNTIYKQEISGTTLKAVTTVTNATKRVYSVSASFIGNNPSVAYSLDMDGDIETYDADLFVNNTNITNDSKNDVSVSYQNDKIYWLKNGYLYSYDGSIVATNLYVNANNYVIANGSGKSAIIFNEPNGFNSELMVSYFEDEEYTNPVQLTNYGEKIGGFDAVLDQNGDPVVSATIRHVYKDQENGVYTSTDFTIEKMSSKVNLSLKDTWYNMDEVTPGSNLTVNATVYNEGTTSVSKYTISVYDKISGNTVNKSIQTTLLPGESEDVDVVFKVPTSLTRRDVEVSITTENNTSEATSSELTLGYSDVLLSSCQITADGLISGAVVNQGYDTANGVTVNIYHLDDEKTLLKKISLDGLNAGASKTYSYTVSSDLLGFDSYLSAPSFYVEVVSENEDSDESNNSKIVSIQPVRVSGVGLDKHSLILAPNDSIQLNKSILPLNATDKRVYWLSSDDSVVSVDENGVIMGVSVGTATIKVISTDGRYEDTCQVTVSSTVPATGIIVNPTSANILVGNTRQLLATVLPENATNKSVTWLSGNTSVATVSSTGLVTAKSVGSAVITAKTADGGYTTTCSVTVTKEAVSVTGISIVPSTVNLFEGKTSQLTATISPSNATNQNVTWSSSKTSVATVSSTGLVTAKSEGTAIITAKTADGGYTATCSVTVMKKTVFVTGISVSPTTVYLIEGKTSQLSATVLPSNATNQNITWSSSKTSVATVSSTGLVTAKSKGNAVITAKTADGGYAETCSVTVTKDTISVTGVSVSPATLSLTEGNSSQLTATIRPTNATNQNVTWSSSKTSVATVSSTGLVTAKASGETVITAKTQDGGYTAVCKVTVTEKTTTKTPISISVASMPNKTTYIYKKEKFDKSGMTLTVNYSDGSWDVISDASQFSVSEIQPKKGKQTLEVNYQGLKTSVDITVKYAWWQWIIVIVLFGWIRY